MKKTIVICDRCNKEITPGRVISPDEGHDLCEDCAMEILRNWFEVPVGIANIEEPEKKQKKKEKKETEENSEGGVAKDRRGYSKIDTGADVRKPADAGTAQALRDAGWSVSAIAEELQCSKATVYNITHPAAPRARKQLEFVDDDLKRLNGTDPAEVQEELMGK